jgi:transcription antitermination factor NusG
VQGLKAVAGKPLLAARKGKSMSEKNAVEFREGDEVVLAEGTYQGTQGVFIRLREDVNWADVTERNGSVRSHPVAWLHHAAAVPGGPVN